MGFFSNLVDFFVRKSIELYDFITSWIVDSLRRLFDGILDWVESVFQGIRQEFVLWVTPSRAKVFTPQRLGQLATQSGVRLEEMNTESLAWQRILQQANTNEYSIGYEPAMAEVGATEQRGRLYIGF